MEIKTLSELKLKIGQDEKELFSIVTKKLGRKPAYFKILKKSLDARDKSNVRFVYSVEYSFKQQTEQEEIIERLPKLKIPEKPVLVVGTGPAGLFCALRLLQRGIKPYVIERGDCVEIREQKNNRFFQEKILDPESNIQFGEGGAGTFSDGKLNTRTHGKKVGEVLKIFASFGAPEEILYLNKPHIGSDNLKKVVKNMREFIINEGGMVAFNTKLTDLFIQNGELQSVTVETNGKQEKLDISALVLAIGHSARDTFQVLKERGVYLRQKDFAIGARIEHLQSSIGFAQYGKSYPLLPAADYQLVSHASKRAAFTFCMCPGGYVMPSASEENGVVTNGMSNYKRDGVNANSALIVQVTSSDFASDDPLAGVEFQRKIERAAFEAGGKDYKAPVQLIGDFLSDKESTAFQSVLPTYAAGTTFADLRSVLPEEIISAMKNAVLDMDRRLKGFACPDGVLTAAETRTSSPVRIERGEDMQSINVKRLYPCGEGAGYSGGITSSAADGLSVADAVYQSFL